MVDIIPLSDYSFLERSVHEIYIWMWFILHVWRCDRFSALKWKHIASLELKSFVTIFIFVALPLGSFYDIISTKIKYVEGFYRYPDPSDIVIRAKPRWLWSEEDKLWFIPSYYILMAALGFQTITLFFLQCFWNYLTNSIAKTSFMSRGEFVTYILWGIICVAMFPVLPYIFGNSEESLQEAIPQLVYATQLLILVILGIRTHVKFLGLIKLTSSYKNSTNLIAKLRYFIDMNKLLTTSLAITTIAFYILSIDLLSSTKIINKSKLASDLLIAHVNFASVIEWLALILIFYPRKGFVGTGAGGSSFNTDGELSNDPSQISNTNSIKFSNVPPGTGAGIINNNYNEKRSVVDVNQANDNYQSTIKSAQVSPDYNNNNNISVDNGIENSQKQNIRKQSSINRFKKQSPSPIPLSDSNSDIGSYSDNNEGNNKQLHLKRNISISRDGKMVYGDTKPLGKVKGAEFVAVEKADPSFIPSYYFSNDKSGNVVRIPSILNDQRYNNDDDRENHDAGRGNSSSSGGSSGSDLQGIMQGVVQQEIIVPQQGTIQQDIVIENEQDSDEDDEFFYAM